MIIYSFDGENESYEFSDESIQAETEKFYVVLNDWNKNTIIERALVEMTRDGLTCIRDANGNDIDLCELDAKIVHNEAIFRDLSDKYGFKFTTADELAEMIQ